jgi:hypothetical protein
VFELSAADVESLIRPLGRADSSEARPVPNIRISGAMFGRL